MNIEISTRPPIPSHIATLTNYRLNLRLNEVNTCAMATMVRYKLNVSIANCSDHFENKVKSSPMAAFNIGGKWVQEEMWTILGGNIWDLQWCHCYKNCKPACQCMCKPKLHANAKYNPVMQALCLCQLYDKDNSVPWMNNTTRVDCVHHALPATSPSYAFSKSFPNPGTT